MIRKLTRAVTSLTVASLLIAAGGLQAEVQCGDPGCTWLIVVGIPEEPDPIIASVKSAISLSSRCWSAQARTNIESSGFE